MQLTQKQESLIARHLRDCAMQMDETLPEKNRERSLRQMQTRIYKDLEAVPSNAITDDDVIAVLRQIRPERPPAATPTARTAPEEPARAAGKGQRTMPPVADNEPAPVWLGVCAFNADRLGVAPWILRLFAVLLGLATGPLAVFCYLAGFAEFYLAADPKDRPAINYGLLLLRAIGPLAVAIGLHWGVFKVQDLIAYGHERVFNEPLPPLESKWDWLGRYEGLAFFLCWASVIPIAILSGLPLANAWGHSLKRLAQALVALYFMALCFGIAAILVGLILDRVQPYMQ